MSAQLDQIAILGAGNIGSALARGLVRSGEYRPAQIILTRRKGQLLEEFSREGFGTTTDNQAAVRQCETVVVAVKPQQLVGLLEEIAPALDPARHVLLSTVSGVTISQIVSLLSKDVPIVRAMPNLAVAIGESMTCLAANGDSEPALGAARAVFNRVGQTLVIDEELMIPATALCACGIAFFLRAIRAASQGGIEIGFHSEEALTMAAQTAKGAAELLLSLEHHPETEIDRVTTPQGCTIAGLNRMEHEGFSSALIRGIVTSAEKADKLFQNNGK